MVKDFLKLRLAGLEHEVFAVLHLDSQHRIVEYVEMFRGTVSQTSVYPREVVKDALKVNSSAVIFVHNDPSGSAEPSRADEAITQTLKSVLSLVDGKRGPRAHLTSAVRRSVRCPARDAAARSPRARYCHHRHRPSRCAR
ncbi:JAB domain-containing protein [Acidovorax sp. SUPP2539]|uniref:JAB domain-containing protein n=1 Tax=Acidovorax sp. SUPP2539 TaxID=2920878 RepID=UPI0024E0B4EC|nr:JAB domain-containing protein [Acidovorax sp. SUPP2539]